MLKRNLIANDAGHIWTAAMVMWERVAINLLRDSGYPHRGGQ